MSLHALAQDMAAKGRNGDSVLVHMAPSEVQGLHALALAHGENVTINPLTGLPEMFSLKKILKAALPAIAGFALGPAGFGLMSSAMAGLTVGGVTALSSGSLSKGLMAGLGAYGGAQLSAGVAGAGAGAAQQAAISGLGEGASQAAMNEAAAAATQNYLGTEGATAALGAGERFMQGIGAVAKDPSAFAQGMGGLGKTLQAGMMAASPVLADQAVETTTGMPGYTPSTAYYRPYEFDPETKGLKSLGSVEAKGMAGGGLADLDSFKKAAERSGPVTINNQQFAPQADPIYGKDGRVNLFMGSGWYSGFASGQELEDLKAKQRAYFAGSSATPQTTTPATALPFTPTTPPGITSTEAIRPTTTITPSTYSVRGEQLAPQTPAAPPAITSTEVVKPTTTITPSTYSVRGEQIAPQTSTAPPAITSTAAARPVAAITPAQLNTQQAAAVPLTSATAPAITARAAPTMPSMPVGGGGATGVAALRPFDYQNTPITRIPEAARPAAEDAMTGESLAAYQRLIGRGAQTQAPAPQASVSTTNPSAFAGYRSTAASTAPTAAPSTTTTNVSDATVGADGTIYEKSADGAQTYTYQVSANVPPTDSMGRPISPGPGKEWYWDGMFQRVRDVQTNNNDVVGYAQGGAISGYALGGQAEYNLGGYSDGGRLLRGPGDGVSDSIPATIGDKQPARLADGEFVVPARIVSELGNGSTESGARKLYTMMDRVQRARGQTTGANRVATNSHADQYLPA